MLNVGYTQKEKFLLQNVFRSVFTGGHQLIVRDLAFSKSCIAIVSSFGEAFTGAIVHPGEKLKSGNVTSFQPENSKEGLARWRANAHIRITRIPSISRAVGIESDPEGKNFAIIQVFASLFSLEAFPLLFYSRPILIVVSRKYQLLNRHPWATI